MIDAPTADTPPPSAPVGGRRAKLKKAAKIGAIAGAVIFVALQFVPVDGIGNNPPARFNVDAPPEVMKILRESCMDCHSNETRWPWYARIAPPSWLVIRDVKKGRARFNMSEWSDEDEVMKEGIAADKETSWEMIEKDEMPPWFYVPMHPSARLTDDEKATLKKWLLPEEEK